MCFKAIRMSPFKLEFFSIISHGFLKKKRDTGKTKSSTAYRRLPDVWSFLYTSVDSLVESALSETRFPTAHLVMVSLVLSIPTSMVRTSSLIFMTFP